MSIAATPDLASQAPLSAPDKQPDIEKGTPGATTGPQTGEKQQAFSPKFAVLARKEKALRQQSREIEAQREALSREQAEIQQAKTWKSRLAEDPLSVLQEAGLNYDQLTQLILNQNNPENLQYQKIRQEFEQKLKAQEEYTKNQFEQQQTQQYTQAKTQIRNEVSSLVDSDEAFEAIRANGDVAKDAVVELMEQTFKDEGYLMGVEEAVQAVEDHLIEQAYELSKLKKVQSKFAPPPEVVQKPSEPQKPLQTLSNRITPSTTPPLNERERKQRAILAFQGKL